jgi:hypothetical protein
MSCRNCLRRGVLDACNKAQHRVGWHGGIIVYCRDGMRDPAGVIWDILPCIWRAGGADVGRKGAEMPLNTSSTPDSFVSRRLMYYSLGRL